MDARNLLNQNSSQDARRAASDAVFQNLTEYFFNRIVFLNYIYSDFGGSPLGTTSTTNLNTSSRIIDTSDRKMMSLSNESRMKCTFYLRSPSKLVGYILSPASLLGDSLGTIQNLNPLKSYVGIKFDEGEVFAVVKEAGKGEKTYPINFTLRMSDATFTQTFTLEIFYNVTSTDIYIDNQFQASFGSDLIGDGDNSITFYPLLAPGKSIDGTLVNIVVENYQFIQNK
jgi:hypothetical protein